MINRDPLRNREHLDVTIWVKTVSEARKREHWGTRSSRRRKQRKVVREVLAMYPQGKRPALPVVVTLTRIAPWPVKDPHDNYPMALKAVVDEVAVWLGVDDADPRVQWRYGEQQRGRPREYAVRIEVREDRG